jgi:hypothetical protein
VASKGTLPRRGAARHATELTSRLSFAVVSVVRTCLINAQIAAPLFMGHLHRLSKKLHSLLSSIRRIIQTRGHSCGAPTAKRPFGLRLTLSDRFYTPTLIRRDNDREGWVMSHKLAWTVPLLASAMA